MDQNIPVGPPKFSFTIGRRMLAGWFAFACEPYEVIDSEGKTGDRKRREGSYTEE
jgi:hypothetical protein